MTSAPWHVHRDSLGIPHLWAADELTLAYAQGRITAEDRGWQLETDRWRAEGTLAARIGNPGLAWDRLARALRLTDTARRAYTRLHDADRAWVQAYTDGVNDGLPQGRDVPEMHDLAGLRGLMPPHKPWPAWMPLAIMHVGHVLFSGFPNVLWRTHVARTLGPHHPDIDPAVIVDLLSGADAHTGGSNAWALAGSRTASGAPILAGDPHRVLEMPGTYQQIGLTCPEYDVVGLAFPGVPGIAHFGHTGDAAWGVTNAVAHHVEVFTEHLHAHGDRLDAEGPRGLERVDSGEERVVVRATEPGSRPRSVPVRWAETTRGLVLDAAVPHEAQGRWQTTSVRIPARVREDLGSAALRPLLRARSAADVLGALQGWVDPVNRVLAADRSTVLSATVGHVPSLTRDQRRFPRDARAATPADPASPAHPVEVNDTAVDANQRPAAAVDYGFAYAPPDRADRIAELLHGRADTPARPDDQGAIHADTLLRSATPLLAHLRNLNSHLPPDSASVRDRLLAWDHHMSAESTTATLYVTWRHHLARRLLDHPGLAPLRTDHGYPSVLDPWLDPTARVVAVLDALLTTPWLHIDRTTILTDSLAATAQAIAASPHPEQTWGDRHAVLPVHLHLEAHLTPPAIPHHSLAGDDECVHATATGPAGRTVRGPVARWIWDLDDRHASRWNVPFGARGDPRSPHHHDQNTAWSAAHTTRIEHPTHPETP